MDVATFDIEVPDHQPFYIACFSDMHIDSWNFDEAKCREDFEEAKRLNARILIGGDSTDGILPGDKRYSRGRDKLNCDGSINMIVKILYDFLLPYREYIDWIGMGNHENTNLQRSHYDIVLGAVTLLNQNREKPIHHGGYKGFIRYLIQHQDRTSALTIFQYHGKGGSAPVTKGMIDFNRVRSDYEADLYWLQHKHTLIQDPGASRTFVSVKNNLARRQQIAFTSAGYQSDCIERDYNESGYICDFSDTLATASAMGNAVIEAKLKGDAHELTYRVLQ